MLNPQIFRTYDIRGKAEEDFSAADVELIGRAFGTYLQKQGTRQALVAHDNRKTSPLYAERIVRGLLESGIDVFFIGLALTSNLYYARHHYHIDGGVMITASHNPPFYNGFKLCQGLKCIYGEELQQVYQLIKKANFSKGRGVLKILPTATNTYLEAIKERIQLKRPLKIVVDCGNGVTGAFVPRFLRELGCEVITLYGDLDASYPHHIPDPVQLSAHEKLIARVKKEKADLGVMFDGDGDRVGTVDARGNIWLGDMILILLMRHYLPSYPGAKVIVEIKDSEAVVDECQRLGGIPIFWKTGHALLDRKIKEEKAILCAEMSCHYWITPNWYIFDDALFTLANLLQILSSSRESYADLMASIPRYPSTPEYRIACPEEKKEAIVAAVREHFQKICSRVLTIDGIRGYYADGWFLIRKSNTQPLLSVRCEARTEEGLEKIKNLVQEHLNSYPEIHLDWEKQYSIH